MVNTEENMTNIQKAETLVTVRDSETFTAKHVAIGMAIRNMMENPFPDVI